MLLKNNGEKCFGQLWIIWVLYIFMGLSLGFETVAYGVKGRRSAPVKLLVSASFSLSSTINAKNSGV